MNEFVLDVQKMKRGETIQLHPLDRVIDVDWDSLGKFCLLTILRQVES